MVKELKIIGYIMKGASSMYIIKNALHNLVRNRGRNLMVGGIIFVIIVSVVTSLMINNASNEVINDYKSRFGSEVSFIPNMQKMKEEAQKNSTDGRMTMKRPIIAPEDLIKFGESEYLKESIYTAETKGNSEQLKPIDEEKGGGGGSMLSGPGASNQGQAGREYYHKLLGNNYEDFKNGLRELADGQFPENNNECMISTELLENSGLSIGDTITVTSALENMSGGPGNEEYTDISWELTIVGTYVDATDEYSEGRMNNAFTNRRNEIITNFETISEKMVDGLTGINVDAKYYLQNPDMLEEFRDEVYAKGLSNIYDVDTDSASYNKVVGPVEGLKGISITFVIIVLVFGSIILSLLASIAIRERKYEIGVLRAMGLKKSKVIAGLWTETLVITAICLVIGLGVGKLVAQPVTNIMLDKQIAAAEQANNNNNGMPNGGMMNGMGMVTSSVGRPGQANVEPLKDINVSLEWVTVLEIIGIAILLSSLSGVIATRKIIKYEPIKILMERN